MIGTKTKIVRLMEPSLCMGCRFHRIATVQEAGTEDG